VSGRNDLGNHAWRLSLVCAWGHSGISLARWELVNPHSASTTLISHTRLDDLLIDATSALCAEPRHQPEFKFCSDLFQDQARSAAVGVAIFTGCRPCSLGVDLPRVILGVNNRGPNLIETLRIFSLSNSCCDLLAPLIESFSWLVKGPPRILVSVSVLALHEAFDIRRWRFH